VLSIKSYEPEKIRLISEKGGNTHKKPHNINENHTIKFSVSENPTTEVQDHICKNVEFCTFCQKKDHGCVFISFSSSGDCIDPVVLECRKRAHSNDN